MPITRWWSKGRGLPPEDHRSWVSSLGAEPGRPARILAWAPTSTGFVVGSPAALSFSDDDGWRHVGWHQIERGGWNVETRKLSWAQYGGRRGSVELGDPARLPELFRERVAASIVVERFVPVRGDRGLIVNGRRDLGAGGVISWHASLGRGITWSTPGARETADRALAEMRLEYDPNGLAAPVEPPEEPVSPRS